MIILVLMGQRKCDYPGQYAPEAIACSTYSEHEDEPSYLEIAKREHAEGGFFDSVEIVSINIDSDEIERILGPSENRVDGVVVRQ